MRRSPDSTTWARGWLDSLLLERAAFLSSFFSPRFDRYIAGMWTSSSRLTVCFCAKISKHSMLTSQSWVPCPGVGRVPEPRRPGSFVRPARPSRPVSLTAPPLIKVSVRAIRLARQYVDALGYIKLAEKVQVTGCYVPSDADSSSPRLCRCGRGGSIEKQPRQTPVA